MFIDLIKIFVKAGDGGNGAITFHREKYVAAGGPDGGDGGRGGNIVFKVDEGANTLLYFRYKRKFVAENGENGKGGKKHGKSGEDLIIPIPKGTVIRDAATGKIIFDMATADEFIVCKGGRGGFGNRHFATPTRQIPRFAKTGAPGEERELKLELKMLAEVGLIGFPNVGKSSILSRISAAKPKIADYHFTTLYPNLGVVSVGGDGGGFLAADIPGLIEGAAEGAGLGHQFLRHIDRCRLLLHVVDISAADGRNPIEDIEKINSELKKYSDELIERKQIIVANKCDMVDMEDESVKEFLEYARSKDTEVVFVSAATGEGLDEMVKLSGRALKDLPPVTVYEPEYDSEAELISADTSDTKISRDGGKFVVEGKWLFNLMCGINFSDRESLGFFQRALIKHGVIEMLREAGVAEGDTVSIYGFEFDFVF